MHVQVVKIGQVSNVEKMDNLVNVEYKYQTKEAIQVTTKMVSMQSQWQWHRYVIFCWKK